MEMGGIDSLPTEYGYVVCVLVLYFFVNFYMSIQVGAARKKYNVFYPTLYALESENKDAKLFNCVQRGHQNSLENMPIFFLFLSLGGIKHPIIASIFGLVYTVARFFYFQGYSTGKPKNRMKSMQLGYLATFALVGCSISLAVHLLI